MVAARRSADPLITLRVDGADVEVLDDGVSLLHVLRDQLGLRTVKDGCSPQGQCGCCTVWVDGAPRISCVTPVRRVAGRAVTTLAGLPDRVRDRWVEALTATGGSQCGFCTPGIIMRLAALSASATVPQALVAHLCRCTGWQTIEEAARLVFDATADAESDGADRHAGARDLLRAEERAAIEGGVPQRVGPEVALGRGGFADDTAPVDALVAVPDGNGDYVVAETLPQARAIAGKVQGRRTTVPPRHPLDLPVGDWELTLRTTWVEPAYVEPDASWCTPGGDPVSPCANGGAFGGKRDSPVAAAARRLADEHARPVRVLWSREDAVRWGPKRPPVAAGLAADGTGVLRVGVTGGLWDDDQLASVKESIAAVAPGLALECVPIAGPAVSTALRGAVWAEAAVLAACLRVMTERDPAAPAEAAVEMVSPSGGRAVARCMEDGSFVVTVAAGEMLDDVVMRSYCIGAAHQAISWVRSEGIAVDEEGSVLDLTVRSFGIVQARDTPRITVMVDRGAVGPPVNGSDAVFAAVAAAAWLADGLVSEWPTARSRIGMANVVATATA